MVEWDGTPLECTFYAEDLREVIVMDDDLSREEKITRPKGDKVLVQTSTTDGWRTGL